MVAALLGCSPTSDSMHRRSGEGRHAGIAMRGGPYTDAERIGLLDYCQTDVDALARLLPRMLPKIDLPRALLRGRYMAAVARMERTGVPIDADTLGGLRTNWDRIKSRLVREVDRDYGVFVPTGRRLDPDTRFGSAVSTAAKEWNSTRTRLPKRLEYVHRIDTEGTRDRLEAIRAARQATGTHNGPRRPVARHRQGLRSTYRASTCRPANSLASCRTWASASATTPTGWMKITAPKLWDVLTEPDPVSLPEHHPDTIRRAAEMIDGGERHVTDGPLTFSASRWAEYLARKRIPWPRLPSGRWPSMMTRFGKWRGATRRKSGRFVSYGTRSGNSA